MTGTLLTASVTRSAVTVDTQPQSLLGLFHYIELVRYAYVDALYKFTFHHHHHHHHHCNKRYM